MKFTLLSVLILLKSSIINGELTFPMNMSQARIVGGHEAQPNSHPYMVSLQLRILFTTSHFCGGSLLSENWIVTAAHCVSTSWLIRLLPMEAVAGAHNVMDYDSKAQVQRVAERIPHPLYEGGIGPYDIAMLKTQSPFTFTKEIKPIMLPRSMEYKQLNAMSLVGWGLLRTTIFFPDAPTKLQEAGVSYLSYKAVDSVLEPNEKNPLDEEANICTGPITGGIAACNGDSGGPLIQSVERSKSKQTRENNTEETTQQIPVLFGVVSWGATPCGQKGAPTVYTNVSNYIDFINYNMDFQ